MKEKFVHVPDLDSFDFALFFFDSFAHLLCLSNVAIRKLTYFLFYLLCPAGLD